MSLCKLQRNIFQFRIHFLQILLLDRQSQTGPQGHCEANLTGSLKDVILFSLLAHREQGLMMSYIDEAL
jgi:hypothetical protein